MFERRKDVGEIGQPILRPGLGHDGRDCPAVCGPRSTACHSPSRPLNTRIVSPAAEPQHIAEIIALVALERDRFAAPPARHRRTAGAGENRVEACSMVPFRRSFSPKEED